MAEQHYRVVADRDKGDNPKPRQAAAGDRLTYQVESNGVDRTLIRIERPVPSEHCLGTVDHPAHVWTGKPGTHYWCKGYDAPEERLPTREQIAEVLTSWFPEYEGVGSVIDDTTRDLFALIQSGADRG